MLDPSEANPAHPTNTGALTPLPCVEALLVGFGPFGAVGETYGLPVKCVLVVFIRNHNRLATAGCRRIPSFDWTLPTPRFYPPPLGHPTSTTGCFCGVRPGRFVYRWISAAFQELLPLRRVDATIPPQGSDHPVEARSRMSPTVCVRVGSPFRTPDVSGREQEVKGLAPGRVVSFDEQRSKRRTSGQSPAWRPPCSLSCACSRGCELDQPDRTASAEPA